METEFPAVALAVSDGFASGVLDTAGFLVARFFSDAFFDLSGFFTDGPGSVCSGGFELSFLSVLPDGLPVLRAPVSSSGGYVLVSV